MTQTLELSDKDFKRTSIIMLSEVRENTPRMNEKIINLSREERNIKMSQKEILELAYGILKNIQIVQKRTKKGKWKEKK